MCKMCKSFRLFLFSFTGGKNKLNKHHGVKIKRKAKENKTKQN